MGRKETEQKRVRRGRRGRREAKEKGGREQTAGFLALWRTGTLAPVQALACVGRATIDADGSRGFPTVLPMSREMFTRRRTHQCLMHILNPSSHFSVLSHKPQSGAVVVRRRGSFLPSSVFLSIFFSPSFLAFCSSVLPVSNRSLLIILFPLYL